MGRRAATVAAAFTGAALATLVILVPAGAHHRPWHQPTTTTQPGATTTTIQATTTTTAPSGGCVGVQLQPGQSVQGAVNANPNGTTFCFAAGAYPLSTYVTPKPGNRFVGAPGAVFNGGGTTPTALAGFGDGQANVTVTGLGFTRFAGGGANGTVAAVRTTNGWVVQDSEFYDNKIGIAGYGGGVTIRGNVIRDNWQYGVVGTPAVLADNEIARNNNQRFSTYDAGGTKFVHVPLAGMMITGNWVHDNYGPGLWCDWDPCTNITYDNNTVERNVLAGIFHEVGGRATISNNTVVGNGLITGGLYYQGDIVVATSHDVEVFGNTVITNANGIVLTDVDRCAGCALANVYVHDNAVTLTGPGVAAGLAGRPASYAAGNRFVNNDYDVPTTTGAWWQWSSGMVTWAGWQAAGQDLTGSVV